MKAIRKMKDTCIILYKKVKIFPVDCLQGCHGRVIVENIPTDLEKKKTNLDKRMSTLGRP